MTNAQKELLLFVHSNSRLPVIDEAVDMYVKHSLTNDGRCFITNNGKQINLEYDYIELKNRAYLWLKNSIGSLVLQDKLHLKEII